MNRVRSSIGCEERSCLRYTGRNVGVAIMDTGIFIHGDLKSRVVAFFDTINGRTYPYDDNGHGTHVTGIVAGSGQCSNGKYRGIAPGCHVVGVRILDQRGNGSIGHLLKGVDWVLQNQKRFGIRIVNISVGMFPQVEVKERNALIQGVESLWDEGIVVVAAAGNNGPNPGTITYPGISRKIITVGTVSEQYAKKQYSGRGPTPFCVMKPEIIAPGLQIISCKNAETGYTMKSGTSMATPVVTGAIGCLLEKRSYMTPMEVKLKLHDSAVSLGLSKNIQGWGKLDLPNLLD